jgi:hypothetical protein
MMPESRNNEQIMEQMSIASQWLTERTPKHYKKVSIATQRL